MLKGFRSVLGLSLLCGIGLVVWLIATDFALLDHMRAVQRWIAAQGPEGAALYPLFYALCNVLLLPGGILSVGGGFFFGLWWGFALVLTGNVLGAALAFGLSRLIGRRWFETKLLHRPRWAAFDRAIEREGWKIIMLSQIHPLFPTSLINYLYGITRIRFGECMLWVAIGQAPGLFLYVYLGTLAQLGIKLWSGENHPALIEYIKWGGGLLLTLLVTTALGRIALKLLREIEETPAVVPAEEEAQPEEHPQPAL